MGLTTEILGQLRTPLTQLVDCLAFPEQTKIVQALLNRREQVKEFISKLVTEGSAVVDDGVTYIQHSPSGLSATINKEGDAFFSNRTIEVRGANNKPIFREKVSFKDGQPENPELTVFTTENKPEVFQQLENGEYHCKIDDQELF